MTAVSPDFPQFSSGHTDQLPTVDFLFCSLSSTPPIPTGGLFLTPHFGDSPSFLLRPASATTLEFQSKAAP